MFLPKVPILFIMILFVCLTSISNLLLYNILIKLLIMKKNMFYTPLLCPAVDCDRELNNVFLMINFHTYIKT